MRTNPKISIIIPIYNAEKYLHKCIDSILNQTLTDYEILLIDDGSTDNSGEICDNYAQKDNRIRVFHKTNEGISTTREFGVNIAIGNYIQFVDSDDWIESNMLEVMYNKTFNAPDIVACNFIQEYRDKSIKTFAIYPNKEDFTRSVISNYWGVLWKLLIRRELFINHDIHFPLGIDGGEDYYVVSNLLIKCKNIEFVDFYPYHYIRDNNQSFISTPSLKKLMYQVEATSLVEKLLLKNNILDKYQREIDLRKSFTKVSILQHYFLNGCKVFTELGYKQAFRTPGLRNKVLLILSNIFKTIL